MLTRIIWILYTRYSNLLLLIRSNYYCRVLKKCGKNLHVNSGSVISFPQNIEIGDDLFIASNTSLNGHGGLKIGNKVLIARDVNIWTSNHAFADIYIPIADQGYSLHPVSIGNDVWIGSNVIILGGVTIGNGVVVGAGSIVTKDIPDYAVAVGNPAKIIRYRNKSI